MEMDELKHYLLSKPEALEDYPFGVDVLVTKIHSKMFALVGTKEGKLSINLKCEPHEAVQLRDVFEAVKPGYHMNKVHWNTVVLDGSLPQGEIERMIDNSYKLVVKGLKKSSRVALEAKYGEEVV